MTERAWVPILDGELADEARRAVIDVARAIASGQGTARDPTDLTLFWAYVAGAIDEDWTSAAYDAATQQLCEWIAAEVPHFALHGGLAGAGWVLAHVSEDDAAEEILGAVDDALASVLAVERWSRHYDLIGGLTGLGVYFLERGERGRAGLARVVDHLATLAETTAEGTAWFTQPDAIPPLQRERWGNGYFNCGLAHGVPGPIALLGRIATLPDADPRARELCEGALAWLAAQAMPPDERGRYPSSRDRDQRGHHPTRTAWCYGEPGIAIAAIGAAKRIGVPVEPWLAIARAAATRDEALCGVNDAGFCHGSAGLAHVFDRIYQCTGEDVFREASRRWFRRALEMRRPDGLGGFAAWIVDGGSFVFAPAADLIEGAAGVALALLAGLQPSEPNWDRIVQCDLP